MNLGKVAAKTGDIRFAAVVIEPTEHCVKFVAQNEPRKQQRQLLIFHGLAEDATKDLDGFRVGQFASCDFQLLADEPLRAFKGPRYESADVVCGNRLVGLIRANKVR